MLKDESRIQELRNSIAEGEMILKSKKTANGRKMDINELLAVKLSIYNARQKIAILEG